MSLGAVASSLASSAGSAAGASSAGSVWSGIGSAAVSAGSSFLAGPQNLYLNKKEAKSQAKRQFHYYQKQAVTDYQLSKLYDEKNYKLAERYAKNSASWTVEGLRRAGLNPILAAQGALSAGASMGQSGSEARGSFPSLGGNSHHAQTRIDMAEAFRDIGSLDVQSATAAKLRADTNVAQAEADKVKADTTIGILRAMNEERTGGLGGAAGLIHEWAKGLNDGNNHNATRELLNGLLKSNGHSTKSDWSVGSGVKDFVSWLSHMLPTRATLPPTSSKSKGAVFQDVSNAKQLNEVVSPAPFPVPSAPFPQLYPLTPLKDTTKKRPKGVNIRVK